MVSHDACLPLNPSSIRSAHARISSHIHRTPLLTSKTLDTLVSSPSFSSSLSIAGTAPRIRLHFKCENYQRIGAFKARGAFHALSHLIEVMGIGEVRRRGVVTHSSGNHAQALALAAHTFAVPAYIVMPSISTPSKIAGTQAYTSNVLFSGSTSQEREAKVAEVVRDTGAVLIPPYDHPDIVLGQGTTALEMDEQFQETREADEAGGSTDQKKNFDLVICPLGGGGILSGIATYFSDRPSTRVFGAEPSYQGCDDGKRGLEANPPSRITSVKSLTIADGLRTPVGEIPWQVFTQGSSSSKPNFLEGIRSVSEQEIKDAMRLLMERMKLFVEPSAAVGLAALLYDEEFRQWIVHEQLRGSQDGQQQVWDVGVVLTGGNTTIEAIAGMFSGEAENKPREAAGATTTSREQGKVGLDGKRVAENIAG